MSDTHENMEKLDLVVKHLTGEITSDEQNTLQEWLEMDPGNQELFESYRKTWEGMDKVSGITSEDIDKEWLRLENAIDSDARVVSMKPEKHTRRRFLSIAASIAVLITSFALLYWFIFQSPGIQIEAGNNSIQHEFPDGSFASLNYNSTISYKKTYNKNTRRIDLAGEAFFEVQKDPEKPFIISSGDLEVKVLGTSFNVNAYPESDLIDVVVKTGRVSVETTGKMTNMVILEPGERATFTKTDQELTKSVNNNINYQAWKTRRIEFEETTLGEAVKVLSNVYNHKINIDSPALAECRITVTFDSQELDAVLAVISSTLDISINETDSQITLSGEGCRTQ